MGVDEFATIDFDRKKRCGASEVIYGAGKTAAQIIQIAMELVNGGEQIVLITRINVEKAALLITECERKSLVFYYAEISETFVIGQYPEAHGIGKVAVVTAGTSDMKVAKEAVVTLKAFGNDVIEIYDVGVAGIHRLMDRIDEIRQATVVIAIAGMEGALASVIGGLVSAPVIAVPTSIGYGAEFEGLSALLSMMKSC